MRRIWACLLLLCVGLTIPAVGGPVRFCLSALVPSSCQERHCCCEHDEEDGNRDLCCVELDSLPDGQQPAPQPVVPATPVLELGHWDEGILRMTPSPFRAVERIVSHLPGPAPPSVRRAVLAIWRL